LGAHARRFATRTDIILLALGALLILAQWAYSWGDALPEELYTGMQARSLWQTGKTLEGTVWPALLPGWIGEGEGSLLAALAAPLVGLFGLHTWAVRLPLMALQIVCVLALWHLLRGAFSLCAARWGALLLAACPWTLLQARWALSWYLLPHLLLLATWMLCKRRPGWLLGGMVTLGLALYTGDAAWYIVPLYALWALAVPGCRRGVKPRWLLAGAAVFLLLALPVLGSLGQDAHAGDWVGLRPKPVTSNYGPRVPAQAGYGLQMLPFLRGDAHVATLHTDILSAVDGLIRRSVLQYAEDPGYTMAYLLPAYGTMQLFSVPLLLLGALWGLVRLRKRIAAGKVSCVCAEAAGQDETETREGARGAVCWLLAGWGIAALVFLLTHVGLPFSHYAALFYPALILTTGGILYVTRRVRFSPVLLAALYLAGLGAFLVTAYDPAPTFPGLDEALVCAAQSGMRRVAVTTRLYPNDNPGLVAALNAMWAFDLSPAYVRGEAASAGSLPYAQRFACLSFADTPPQPWTDTAYVLYGPEADLADPDAFAFTYAGDFVTLLPLP
jgi:4-amino-4-deoxy-L-arabinose transferase-like glycosyltransferase